MLYVDSRSRINCYFNVFRQLTTLLTEILRSCALRAKQTAFLDRSKFYLLLKRAKFLVTGDILTLPVLSL
jgi:hypothetical protein